MTDTPGDGDARVNLSEAANLTCQHVELIVYPLDPTTLGLALALTTTEFGQIAVAVSIDQVADLAEQCARATKTTPQEMAALMRLIQEGKPQ